MTKPTALKVDIPKMRLEQRLTVRERIFFIVVLIGVLMLFVNYVWKPRSEIIKQRKTEIKEIEQQASALESLVESTKQQLFVEQSAPNNAPKLDEHIKKMLERKVIDPLSEIHTTVSMLSGRKLAQGVKVNDVEIGDQVDHETYVSVPISLNVTARFGSLQTYNGALRRLNRPIIVRKLNINRSASGAGLIDVSMELELFIPKN